MARAPGASCPTVAAQATGAVTVCHPPRSTPKAAAPAGSPWATVLGPVGVAASAGAESDNPAAMRATAVPMTHLTGRRMSAPAAEEVLDMGLPSTTRFRHFG